MNDASVSYLVARCKEEYQRLLQLSCDLLRDFDLCTSGRGENLLARRQEIVDALKEIDASLEGRPVPASDRRLMDELALFRAEITEKILANDDLVIGLARQRQAELKGKLSGISSKKTAFAAYTGNAGGPPRPRR